MKKKGKAIVDIIMYFILILCMGYQVTGNYWHELIGILMFVLFAVHLVLNGYWFLNFKSIAKKSFSSLRSCLIFLTDVVLLLDMIIMAVTSVFISKDLFAFLGLSGNRFLIRLHSFCAYMGLIIICVHIGCHWKSILFRINSFLGIEKDNKPIKTSCRILALIMAILGLMFSFKRDIGRKLFFDLDKKFMGKGMPDDMKQKPEEGRRMGPRKDMESFENTKTETVDNGESQEDYLGRLNCTGCGRHCSLLSPRCGKGEIQAKQAIEDYNEKVSNSQVEDIEKNEEKDEDTKLKNSQDNTNKPQGEEKVLKLSGEEDFVHLFIDFIPITGLYIAGTYYLLEIVEKKKSDKEE